METRNTAVLQASRIELNPAPGEYVFVGHVDRCVKPDRFMIAQLKAVDLSGNRRPILYNFMGFTVIDESRDKNGFRLEYTPGRNSQCLSRSVLMFDPHHLRLKDMKIRITSDWKYCLRFPGPNLPQCRVYYGPDEKKDVEFIDLKTANVVITVEHSGLLDEPTAKEE